MKKILGLFLSVFFLGMAGIYADAFSLNKRLGRGVNMGNMLEAPSEGEWGVKLNEDYFKIIAEKGFTMVRIPVRWSATGRSLTAPPYTVDPAFFARVDKAINAALKNKLMVVVNWHHYDELFKDPDNNYDRFIAVWKQISERYGQYSDDLLFEIMNEPNDKLTAEKWNSFFGDALAVIRKTNPTRAIVIGTAEWGGIGALKKLNLPTGDSNLILTIHYYSPFHFTHQGADWVKGSDPWLGTKWNGNYYDKKAVIDDMEQVRVWAQEHKIPVYVGEFGAYSKGDMASRIRWTSYCARLFEKLGFSWSYWEFCAGFGIYDASTKTWKDGLLNALISNDTSILDLGNPPDPEKDKKKYGSLLKNGDFSKGMDGWIFGVWKGKAKGTVGSDGVFTAVISDPGKDRWNIQLLQLELIIANGHSYVVYFDAWAEKDRLIYSSIENSVDYTPYSSSSEFQLTKEKKSFFYPFTKSGSTDPKGRISFSLGGEAPTVHICNVKILDLGK